MIKLTKDRISKLRCLSCGARQKRIVFLQPRVLTYKGSPNSFMTVCCNCGHIQHYFLMDHQNPSQVDSQLHYVFEEQQSITDVICGVKNSFCPFKNCEHWGDCYRKPQRPGDELPRTVYTPRVDNQWKPVSPAKPNCDNTRKPPYGRKEDHYRPRRKKEPIHQDLPHLSRRVDKPTDGGNRFM